MGRRWEAEKRGSAVRSSAEEMNVSRSLYKKKKIAMLVFVCCFVVFFFSFVFEVGKKRDCEFCRAGRRLVEWTMPVVTQVRRE